MTAEQVSKLIKYVPKGLSNDDFLVALVNLAVSDEREECATRVWGKLIDLNLSWHIREAVINAIRKKQ